MGLNAKHAQTGRLTPATPLQLNSEITRQDASGLPVFVPCAKNGGVQAVKSAREVPMSAVFPAFQDAADASEKKRLKRRRRWLRIEAFVESAFIYLMLYALSIGPLYWQWVAAKMGTGPRVLAAFYEPLLWLGRLIPPLGYWLNWYVNLWTS
jgi:hypothetical protein